MLLWQANAALAGASWHWQALAAVAAVARVWLGELGCGLLFFALRPLNSGVASRAANAIKSLVVSRQVAKSVPAVGLVH